MNKELIYRTLTAFIAGGISVSAIAYAPGGLWVFCGVVSMAGVAEFWRVSGIRARRYTWTTWAWGLLGWVLVAAWRLFGIEGENQTWIWTWAVSLYPALALLALFNEKEKNPLQTLSLMGFSYWYVYLPLVLFFLFSVPGPTLIYDSRLPLGILFLTWFLDSGSYFAGKAWGKHPIFPRISPKKTWEGAIGGAVICWITGYFLEQYWKIPGVSWIIISVIISVVSQLGDMIESMFKRSVHLKDSGSILPGHGGMLDRFDGFFLSIPFIQLYFLLSGI